MPRYIRQNTQTIENMLNSWYEWMTSSSSSNKRTYNMEEKAKALYKNTYGNPAFMSPLGVKRFMIHADATASGFFYRPIETYLQTNVWPFYNNTHSNAFGGQMMNLFMSKAKEKIRQSVRAAPQDKVLFTGNGCTGAIQHVIHMLNLRSPCATLADKPVVFISEAEHHSNDLPWRHLPIDLVVIPVDLETGLIHLSKLNRHLKKFADRKLKLVSVVAVSNITGVIQPIDAICVIAHKYGGKVMFDYATGAPYVPINMNTHPTSGKYMDIVVLSMHKFLGGPAAPGVLVVKDACCKNDVPFCPGGGTVRFVSDETQTYSDDIETRENGGTPNIVGCIKAGLCFELKDSLQDFITLREQWLLRYIQPQLTALVGQTRIELMNPVGNMHRIPIFSFRVPNIHYNLVVALMSDLFGIQTRGGISCCSMYAQKLLGISAEKKAEIQATITQNKGVPAYYGWCRITFHYTMPKYMVDYILQAIAFVSMHAHTLQARYMYDPKKNNWRVAKAADNNMELLVEQTLDTFTTNTFPSEYQLQKIIDNNNLLLVSKKN